VAATLSWAGGSTRRKGCRVAEPWAQSYESLRTSSRAVLRGLAVLELRTLPEADLPAAGGISDNRELRPVLTELADSGWISGDADGWRVATAPGRWLAHLAHRVDPAQAIDHVTRFAAHLREVVAADHNPLRAGGVNRGAAIVAAVRAAGEHGLADLGIALAAAAWQAALPGGDRDWWRQLAEAGEEVAIEARESVALVGLLETSGAAFARAGDAHIADRQWRRAFALTERLGDRERSAALLGEIGLLRRTYGSFGRALTAFHELVARSGRRQGRVDHLVAGGPKRVELPRGEPGQTVGGLASHGFGQLQRFEGDRPGARPAHRCRTAPAPLSLSGGPAASTWYDLIRTEPTLPDAGSGSTVSAAKR
jgi:hypothetical protein